jgi:DNA-binding winged helix-turn-helix (wHTH) protein
MKTKSIYEHLLTGALLPHPADDYQKASLKVHICHLRKKLPMGQTIITIPGEGYILEDLQQRDHQNSNFCSRARPRSHASIGSGALSLRSSATLTKTT